MLPNLRDPRQYLLSQQHEGLVAEWSAEQIVETDLVAQPRDLVAHLVGRTVQDHLIEIALKRVDAGWRERSLHYRAMLLAEIGVEDPLGAAARDGGSLARIVGERHEPSDGDIAARFGEASGGQPVGVEPPLAADLGTR